MYQHFTCFGFCGGAVHISLFHICLDHQNICQAIKYLGFRGGAVFRSPKFDICLNHQNICYQAI